MLFKFTAKVNGTTFIIEADNKDEALNLFALDRCNYNIPENVTDEERKAIQEKFNINFSIERKILENDWECEVLVDEYWKFINTDTMEFNNPHLFKLLDNYLGNK